MMDKKNIVSEIVYDEMWRIHWRFAKDFLSRKRQAKLGLRVEGISSIQKQQDTTEWKKWRANWRRRRVQINQYFGEDIYRAEDFMENQKKIISPERLCFYLAAYCCLAQEHEKEAIENRYLRWKELRG